MGKTDKMRAIADKYSEEIESYKQYADARRNSRIYTQEMLLEFYERMKAYLTDCKETGTPMTVGGLCLAMGADRTALYRMKTGFYDWRMYEYMKLHDVSEEDVREENDEFFKGHAPLQYCIDERGEIVLLMMYSEVIGVGLAQIEAENEAGLFGSKPAGRIFYLKSVFGYSDTPESTQNNEPSLVIADAKQAEKAMRMLMNDDYKEKDTSTE